MGHADPPSQSLLCLLAAGPQDWLCCLPSWPGASHPQPREPHTRGPLALSLQLGASPGQGCPGGTKQVSPGQQFQEGEPGRNNGPVVSGLWLMCWGPVCGGDSRMDSGHIRGGSYWGSSHCVGTWGCEGVGSPKPPSLAKPCPGQPTLGSGSSALASGLCGLSLGHRAAASRPQLLLGLRPPEPSVTLSC